MTVVREQVCDSPRAPRLLVLVLLALAAADMACAAATGAAPPGASQATTPQDWLARMERALATRNYRGVFEDRQGARTVSLRIVHRVQDGVVEERIAALDGSGREFIRRGGEVYRYLPDQRLVQVEPSRDAGLLLAELRRVDVAASGQYTLRELSAAIQSGRPVHVIQVQPRDRFRYGYQLWIDESTAMPIKTQLLGPDGEVLEQLLFTELSLPKQVPDEQLAAQTDVTGYTWQRTMGVAAIPELNTSDASAWQAADLPPGFHMTVRSLQALPGSQQPVMQLVYTDGLAAVSVFVEQGNTPVAVDDTAAEVVRLGSSSAYSTVVQGYRVTAVGEVPPATLRAIAGSVMPGARGLAPSGGGRRPGAAAASGLRELRR
jgi:sigma-E factor negative regulatory protein RseB